MSDAADPSSPSPSPSDKQHDVFGPPPEPIEVHCLHCHHVYTSDLIVPITAADGSIHHACPVPKCDGMGFGFDIHPTDPTWCNEEMGYFQSEDDEDDEADLFDTDDDSDSDSDIDTDDAAPFLVHGDAGDDEDDQGDLIAAEMSESEGQFDPPKDWTPETDREDGDFGEFDLFDFDEDDPDAHYERPAPKRFTRDDFDKAKAEGVYDKLAETIRAWWSSCERRRSETDFNDDDIPF